MTESGLEFPRERESTNSVQSFALGRSTESRAVAPGKPLETDFSSEAKLRRLTVRPLQFGLTKREKSGLWPPFPTGGSRAL